MNLCQFKNSLGKPNEGFHKSRFLGLAIFDVIGTILVAALIAYWFQLSYVKIIGYAFLSGVFFHWLFCVDTAFAKTLKQISKSISSIIPPR